MKQIVPTPPLFSIVIPTLNKELFLPQLLADLSKQTFTQFEIIHVDGNSDDQTTEVAHSFSKNLRLRTILVTERNVSFQRNTGAEAARGEWVVFMDADNRIKKTFLQQLRNKIEEKNDVDVFTCLIETQKLPMALKNLFEMSNIVMMMTARVRPFAPGAMIGIRRSKLKSLCFDCAAKMSEDHMFIESAVNTGCRYAVFRQPKYAYSPRRFEKEGILKVLADYLRSAVVLLAGSKFEKFLPEYPMEGGTPYQYTELGIHGLLPSVGDIIRSTTKRQQSKLKKFVLSVQNLINDL